MIGQMEKRRTASVAAMDKLPERFLRLTTVMEMTGLSRTSINTYIRAGKFPKNVSLCGNRVAWLSSEVEQWMQERINERNKR